MKKLIETQNLTFSYLGKKTLFGISVSINQGDVLAVLGPNGSGKTTFIKMIVGLLKPDHGNILLDGRNVATYSRKELARKIAYVPQIHREAFGYSAEDIVIMGRISHISLLGRYGKKDRKVAVESLEKMSVGHLSKSPYTEISGGERQLVLIARAIAQEAEIIVMDEPSSSLDFGNQLKLLATVRRLATEGYTFIFTTHHPDHALSVAGRVIMIKSGRILKKGNPADVITADNIMNLYDLDESFMNSDSIGVQ